MSAFFDNQNVDVGGGYTKNGKKKRHKKLHDDSYLSEKAPESSRLWKKRVAFVTELEKKKPNSFASAFS